MNLFALSSLILFIASISFGILVFLGDRKSSISRWWFFVSLTTAFWGLALYGVTSAKSSSIALGWQYLLDIAAIFIPILYFNFILTFLKKSAPVARLLAFGSAVLLALISFTPYFKLGVRPYLDFYWINPGILYFSFPLVFFLFVLLSVGLLLKEFFTTKDEHSKKQIKYILISGILGFGGGITNFFPQLFNIYPFGNYFVIIYVILMSYSVLRHGLFNIKVIATQLLVFALWLFLLIRLFLEKTPQDKIIDLVILVATIIIGALVIRSVIKEVHTRERIEALADELAQANARLKELDRQKSEFVSIASHQLRSPLTAIKGYSSMILEGSFGPIPEKAHEAINRIFESSQRLVIIIEDFLNISRIEQGRMQYEFATVDLAKTVKEVVQEMEGNFKRANLTLDYKEGSAGPFEVTADAGKIRQVVNNIIDNGIKYTPTGGITVTLRKDEVRHKVLLEVSDTGIGIPADVMPRLFEKFSRAEDAGKSNITGTGLGLFVAKEIMKAHRGNIWVDSEGKGKGSTFYLEFMGE